MKPLPRWLNVVSIVAAVFGALNVADVLHLVTPTIGAVIIGGAAITSYASKQLIGDGIPVGFGWISLIVAAFGTLNTVSYTNAAGETVQILSMLPPWVGAILAAAGALGAALTNAEHSRSGKVLGTGAGPGT